MFFAPKKKRKPLKLVGDSSEEWLAKRDLKYCIFWNAVMKPGICEERKKIADQNKNRFSLGNSMIFNSFDRCLECQTGMLPASKKGEQKMEEFKQEYPPREVVYPKGWKPNKDELSSALVHSVGDVCTCEKCGGAFEAYKSGRMICHKICRPCVTKGRQETIQEKNLQQETLKNIPDTPVPELIKEQNTEGILFDFPAKILIGKNPIMDLTEVQKLSEKEKYESPIVDEIRKYPMWMEELFIDEEKLLEKVEKDAKKQRRTFRQHILFLLEDRFYAMED
jgi:hypothetical protein